MECSGVCVLCRNGMAMHPQNLVVDGVASRLVECVSKIGKSIRMHQVIHVEERDEIRRESLCSHIAVFGSVLKLRGIENVDLESAIGKA